MQLIKIFACVLFFILGSLLLGMFMGGVLKRNQPSEQEPLLDDGEAAERRDRMKQKLEKRINDLQGGYDL